ncbi:hypothetical protein NL676_014663 [Syzygium grande]|nr:hypothetical protein NL676_014663 [Syzygium grande]
MGEEEEDPQKPRRIAAAAYDYGNDPRWADYWSNILIPRRCPPARASSTTTSASSTGASSIAISLSSQCLPVVHLSRQGNLHRPQLQQRPMSSLDPVAPDLLPEALAHQQLQLQIQLLCAGIGKLYNSLSMLGF